jgi:hypothetical protein
MTKQWLSDLRHGRGGRSLRSEVMRTCITCGKDATPRYLYCSDECAHVSHVATLEKRDLTCDGRCGLIRPPQ